MNCKSCKGKGFHPTIEDDLDCRRCKGTGIDPDTIVEMRKKFLEGVISRCKDKLSIKPFNRKVYDLGFIAFEVLLTPDIEGDSNA